MLQANDLKSGFHIPKPKIQKRLYAKENITYIRIMGIFLSTDYNLNFYEVHIFLARRLPARMVIRYLFYTYVIIITIIIPWQKSNYVLPHPKG